MRLTLALSLALASCSPPTPDYGSGANEIQGSIGTLPQSVKLAAAEILRRCDIPLEGRAIFYNWEGTTGDVPYVLLLTHNQFEDPKAKTCLHAQIKFLGLSSEMEIGEEPPPELFEPSEKP